MKILAILFSGLLIFACGGGGGGNSSDGPTQIPNREPILELLGVVTVLEGTPTVASLSATDADGDTLRFSISSGDDRNSFSISTSGQLDFIQAPDFETPGDNDSDNDYSLVIQVSDGTATDTQALVVRVRNALEGRVVDAPVIGATVFVDVDGDGVQSATETSVFTSDNGIFSWTCLRQRTVLP